MVRTPDFDPTTAASMPRQASMVQPVIVPGVIRRPAVDTLLAESFGGRCLVMAGPGEEGVQEEIVSRMKSSPLAPAPKELPLDVLKGVVKRLALLVTNDTGPRQYASAFSIPSVVLMGPTDPRYTYSPLERSKVLRADVDCGPCHLKSCPEDHRCMTALTPEMVVEAATELLGKD